MEGEEMKLTAKLIFDRLSEHFNVRYTVSNNSNTVIGRPVFFQNNCDIAGHLCIVSPQNAPFATLDNGVFISVGDLLPSFALESIELLTVPFDTGLSALFNCLQDIFDYYDAWENELTEIIEKDKGYTEIVECATKYLKCPISIVDDDFTIIAFSDNLGGDFRDIVDQNKISASIMNDIISDPQFSKGLHNYDVFEFNVGGELFLSYNFKKESKYQGRVTLYYKEILSKDAYKFLLRFLAQKIEIMLRKFGFFLIQKQIFSSLREILTGCLRNMPPEKQYIEYKLNENGWSYYDEYMLIRLQPEFRHEWQLHATYLIPLIERMWPGACAIENDQYVVVLLNQTIYSSKSDKSFMQELAYFLRDGLMLAGISRTFRGFTQIASYYRQTELAVSLGRDTDPMCWHYSFDDYALLCWLNNGVLNFTPEQICSRVVLDLIAYDTENSTEYYKTLRAFYNKKYSYTHAADDLYIHRTTLIKRIERIAELTKINMNDPDVNLYIELSFRFLDKVKSSGS